MVAKLDDHWDARTQIVGKGNSSLQHSDFVAHFEWANFGYTSGGFQVRALRQRFPVFSGLRSKESENVPAWGCSY